MTTTPTRTFRAIAGGAPIRSRVRPEPRDAEHDLCPVAVTP